MVSRAPDGGVELFQSFYFKNKKGKVFVYINGEEFTCLDYIDGETAQKAFLNGMHLHLKKTWKGDAGPYSEETMHYMVGLERYKIKEETILLISFKEFNKI